MKIGELRKPLTPRMQFPDNDTFKQRVLEKYISSKPQDLGRSKKKETYAFRYTMWLKVHKTRNQNDIADVFVM